MLLINLIKININKDKISRTKLRDLAVLEGSSVGKYDRCSRLINERCFLK